MGDDGVRLVVTTLPDAAAAEAIARFVVERRLAACAQIVPGVRSVYRWEGTLEVADEWQVWMKTTVDRADELTRGVAERHPYDVPELLTLSVDGVNAPYATWLQAEIEGSDS